jgi:hypothetical protein
MVDEMCRGPQRGRRGSLVRLQEKLGDLRETRQTVWEEVERKWPTGEKLGEVGEFG